ncbi:hypothetical protein BLS_003580 [Venturia inaequalis]|uniref:Uncharacterized protein n=1 Tax=Venturia inaequalis TaxID=5025 RepID=A0A8H3UQM8_VENIN|nr:hypothetical protein BLS_003580 [Venturia inaequalis]
MHTTVWGSQRQFVYSSGGDDGQVHHDQRGKLSQTGARISHVEVMRYEETINHYTTTSENSAPLPQAPPMAYGSFQGPNVESYPVSSDGTISKQHVSPQEEEEEMEEVVRSPSPSTSLELLDSKTRWLFVHFLTQVSPYCIILDDDNGFRSHVLPYAAQDPLVRRAVCVTAAFHLSNKVPSLRADAEVGRGIVIKMLQEIALSNAGPQQFQSQQQRLGDGVGSRSLNAKGSRCSPPAQQRVFAESNIMALRKTLVSFREGRKREGMGQGPLVEFLEYQSGLIEFVARPMSNKPGRDACESFLLDHQKYNTSPAIQHTITQYNSCFRLARRIYHYKMAESTLTLEQSVELGQLAQDLKMILMSIDANVPGSHCPLWPCFVAGCEASNQVERNFFYTRLEMIWLKTWSRNPFVAMKGLLYIWSMGPNVNWAEKISDLDSGRDSLLKDTKPA